MYQHSAESGGETFKIIYGVEKKKSLSLLISPGKNKKTLPQKSFQNTGNYKDVVAPLGNRKIENSSLPRGSVQTREQRRPNGRYCHKIVSEKSRL